MPREALLADLRAGLLVRPRAIPPKYFYDQCGSQLFDQICHLPEYYLMRKEAEILDKLASTIMEAAAPDVLVELGSGAARKTRQLLDVLVKRSPNPGYVAFDLAESMLKQSVQALSVAYPSLEVRGVLGDYERDLALLPRPGGRRLVAFFGSTIGNLSDEEARRFLARLATELGPQEAVLIGFDLVKDSTILHVAYNDAQGITAQFNKNVLYVINRELGADFDVDGFTHVAFFNQPKSRIEMHLQAARDMRVHIAALGAELDLSRDEMIHTENSRKFSLADIQALMNSAGFRTVRVDCSHDDYFALVLARPI